MPARPAQHPPPFALHAALALALAIPAPARGAELVAEAIFLADTMPPAGRDLSLSMAGSAAAPSLAPRAQLAMALGPRLGVAAELGVRRIGERLVADAPSASLKLLARAPARGRTGLSLSLDLAGSPGALEAATGVGAVRVLGGVTARAALWGTSPLAAWSPEVRAGLSGAVALGPRVRLLGEAIGALHGAPRDVAAGPTVKVAIGERSALAAGALLGLAPGAERARFVVQLSRAL